MNLKYSLPDKPKIKPSHPVIEDEDVICIGEIPGYATIIKNPSGWLLPLLNSLDGNKTINEILTHIKNQGFNCSSDEILQVLHKLNSNSFLEDGSIQSQNLTDNELERYHRQILYFSLVEKKSLNGFLYQEQIKKQNIAIFGLGGWGSWIALNLGAAGIGNFTLIDHDTIERSNLNRQILFDTQDIGKSKVEAASLRLKKLNPHINTKLICEKMIPNETAIEKIIKGHTFIVIAWTNLSYFRDNTVEEAIHKAASKNNIPIIEIGADPLFILVGPIFTNNRNGICFNCVKATIRSQHYSLDPLTRSLQESRLVQNRKNLNTVLKSYQSAPALSAMAGLASDQIIKFVTNCESPVTIGTQYKIDLSDYQLTKIKFSPQLNCHICHK